MSKENEKNEYINELYDNYNFLDNFKEKSNKSNVKKLNNNYFFFFKMSSAIIGNIGKGLYFLPYIKLNKWDLGCHYQMFFIKNMIPILYSTNQNLKSGDFLICSILNRTSLESLIRIYFISFNKEDFIGVLGSSYTKIYKENGHKKKIKPFNVTEFLKSTLDGLFLKEYEALSCEAHGNMLFNIEDMVKFKEDTNYTIDFGGKIKSANIDFYCIILYGYLSFLNSNLYSNGKPKNSEQRKIINDSKILGKILKERLDKNSNLYDNIRKIDKLNQRLKVQ